MEQDSIIIEQQIVTGKQKNIIGSAAILSVCAIFILFHSFLIDRLHAAICSMHDTAHEVPHQQRLPVFLNSDALCIGYTWNRHVEDLGAASNFRIRKTDFDSGSFQREVHWNSGFSSYLKVLGTGYRLTTGTNLRNSIFRMSIWANPLLLLASIVFLLYVFTHLFGTFAGGVLLFGMITTPVFYSNFAPAFPHHYGMISLAIIGTLIGIAGAGAGWINSANPNSLYLPHSYKKARKCMIFSALCGASGLWISAISTSMTLIIVGIASIAVCLFLSLNTKNKYEFHPELWQVWGTWGASASLGFYFIEYFPQHLSMRLEVNHPLYSLAWFGGALFIAAAGQRIVKPEKSERCKTKRSITFPLLALVSLPLCILIGGETFYIPLNDFMFRLHQYMYGFMSIPYLVEYQEPINWATVFFHLYGPMPILFIAALIVMLHSRTDTGFRAIMLFLSISLFLSTTVQLYQVRWNQLTGSLYIITAAIATPYFWRLTTQRYVSRTTATVLIGVFIAIFAFTPVKYHLVLPIRQLGALNNEPKQLTPDQKKALRYRHIARGLLHTADHKPVILLTNQPHASTTIAAMGGFRTLGSFYWENLKGTKTAARILTTQNVEKAYHMVKKHNITHIMLEINNDFTRQYYYCLYASHPTNKSLENSFAKRIMHRQEFPPWLYPLHQTPDIMLFRVQSKWH